MGHQGISLVKSRRAEPWGYRPRTKRFSQAFSNDSIGQESLPRQALIHLDQRAGDRARGMFKWALLALHDECVSPIHERPR